MANQAKGYEVGSGELQVDLLGSVHSTEGIKCVEVFLFLEVCLKLNMFNTQCCLRMLMYLVQVKGL